MFLNNNKRAMIDRDVDNIISINEEDYFRSKRILVLNNFVWIFKIFCNKFCNTIFKDAY